MQRQIRRPPQAGRWLHLLRLHAGPLLRYRRAQSDARRTEEDRPGIHALPGEPAPIEHRGCVQCEADRAPGAATGEATGAGAAAGATTAATAAAASRAG